MIYKPIFSFYLAYESQSFNELRYYGLIIVSNIALYILLKIYYKGDKVKLYFSIES